MAVMLEVERLAFAEEFGVDDALRPVDLAIFAVHAEFAAVLFVAPDIAPRAADFQIDLADGHDPAVRPVSQRRTNSGLVRASKIMSGGASKSLAITISSSRA